MKRLHPGDSGSNPVESKCVSGSCPDPQDPPPVKKICNQRLETRVLPMVQLEDSGPLPESSPYNLPAHLIS